MLEKRCSTPTPMGCVFLPQWWGLNQMNMFIWSIFKMLQDALFPMGEALGYQSGMGCPWSIDHRLCDALLTGYGMGESMGGAQGVP